VLERRRRGAGGVDSTGSGDAGGSSNDSSGNGASGSGEGSGGRQEGRKEGNYMVYRLPVMPPSSGKGADASPALMVPRL
jgi:hypothetical protein